MGPWKLYILTTSVRRVQLRVKVDFIHSKEKTNTPNNLLLPFTRINHLIYMWFFFWWFRSGESGTKKQTKWRACAPVLFHLTSINYGSGWLSCLCYKRFYTASLRNLYNQSFHFSHVESCQRRFEIRLSMCRRKLRYIIP